MYSKEINEIAKELIQKVKVFWKNDVSDISIDFTESPYDEFIITMKFFNKFKVAFAYDRSTIDIGIEIRDEYVILNKLTKDLVYRGFKSTYPENLLHNFKVLDKTLKQIMLAEKK